MSKQIKGSLCLILLTSLYGFYGIYNRMIGSTFGTFSQNWVRNLIIILILGFIFLITHKSFKPINKRDLKWLFLWLSSGSIIMLLLFISFNRISISTVYFLFYSTMITSGLVFGKLLFREKLNGVKLISIVLALLGVYFIYSFSIKAGEIPYVLSSLIAGFILGFWNVVSKKFSDNYPNLQLVFFDALASLLVGVVGSIIIRESIPVLNFSSGWIWMIAYAITQIAAVGLVIYGFKNLEAQIASVIMPVEIIFASMFSYLIFQETFSLTTIIGGILIASAAFLPNIQLLLSIKTKKL